MRCALPRDYLLLMLFCAASGFIVRPDTARTEDAIDALAETETTEMRMADAPEPKRSVFDDLLPFLDLPGISEPGKAQTRPDRAAILALTGRTIAKVTANNPPPGFDPADDAAIPLGIPFHAALVREAAVRLFDSGKYRDIQISVRVVGEKQVELIIDVLPMLRVRKLTIRGNNALKNDDAARAVEYTSGRTIQPDPEVLKDLRQKLLDKYALMGYPDAKATLSLLTTTEPGGVELLVNITEGEPDRYTVITVHGLPDNLPRRVSEISKGFNRDRSKLDKVEQKLLLNLAEYGYLDATCAPMQERPIGKHAFELIVTVNPGVQSTVLFEGNSHFRSSKLRELIESDGPIRTDGETLARKAAKIQRHLFEYGFLFAKVGVERRCIRKGRIYSWSLEEQCPLTDASQEIVFRIQEGKVVDVVHVFFSGNKQFTDADLEAELFAFIGGKNKNDDLFQPVSADALNELGVSDKQRNPSRTDSDFKAPRFRRQRVYVPDQYAEAVTHLTGVYQEQGYLSAAVDDTCDLEKRGNLQYRQMTFTPIRLSRVLEDEEESALAGPPCVLVNRDKDQVIVMMKVSEGPQTVLSEVRFKGNRRLASAGLQQVSGMSVNAPYNEFQLREAARKIAEKYRSYGYMFVDVSWRKSFSPDMKRAGIDFSIDEGPLTKVGIIRVEGAESTSTRLIKERLTLRPGDIITPEALEKSQALLMELGIFNGATIQLVSPENKAPVKNLRVQVTEAKPQYLELKGGIATVEGIRGSLEYGFNNLGGFALNATLRARANYRLFFFGAPDFEQRFDQMTLMEQLEHHVLAGLGSPHIPRTNGILGWGMDLIKERLNKPGFSASRFTTFLRINAKFPIGSKYPHGLLFTGKTGIEYNLDISAGNKTDNPVLQNYLRLPEGTSAFSVLGLGAALDLRDSPFNPTRGIYLAVDADWVYSLPFVQNKENWVEGDPVPIDIEEQSNLIRAQATFSGYVPIFTTDIVLAMSVTAGYIFHFQDDSNTWPDRYFYVGGVDTLRGFPEDDLVPEDIYQYWKSNLKTYGSDIDELLNNRGGEAMFITRAELRYPLAKGFYGAGFGEFGNLWRDHREMAPITFSPFKIHLRPVAGVGLRYQTPLGPISFDLGFNLYRRPTELPLSWYISIGSAF